MPYVSDFTSPNQMLNEASCLQVTIYLLTIETSIVFYTLIPRHVDRRFRDIFKWIFLNANIYLE